MNEIAALALIGIPLPVYLLLAFLPARLAIAGLAFAAVCVVAIWQNVYPEDDGKGFVLLAELQVRVLAGAVILAGAMQGLRHLVRPRPRWPYPVLVFGAAGLAAWPISIAARGF